MHFNGSNSSNRSFFPLAYCLAYRGMEMLPPKEENTPVLIILETLSLQLGDSVLCSERFLNIYLEKERYTSKERGADPREAKPFLSPISLIPLLKGLLIA